MKIRYLAASVLFMSLSVSALALPVTKLLLIGGGNHPPQLISRFVGEAGGARAHILVITWATDFPDQAMQQMNAEFKIVPGVLVLEGPRPPLDQSSRNLLLSEINGASGIFFTGGDQTKIMAVMTDPIVRQAFTKFYADGKIVGGTSAGTAIMSPAMMTGRDNELAPGLGLLPGTLVDTHFLVRSRFPRLSAALLKFPKLIGLGIDQDNALWITGGNHVEVFGPTYLTVIATKLDGTQVTRTFKAGQNFNLPESPR